MTTDDLRKMVRECLADDSDRLTDWECTFLEDMDRRHAHAGFTPRQVATVENIWQKLFGGDR